MEKEAINQAIAKVVGQPLDFYSSLDAMHAAVETLKPGQFAAYFYELHKIAGRPYMSLRHQQYLPMVQSTAAQRAEAFLRTLNLWTPTK